MDLVGRSLLVEEGLRAGSIVRGELGFREGEGRPKNV